MKRFKINITEIGTETKVCGKEWTKGADPENMDNYGYTPEIEKMVDYERRIFEQTVDELDLLEVIKAVNGL